MITPDRKILPRLVRGPMPSLSLAVSCAALAVFVSIVPAFLLAQAADDDTLKGFRPVSDFVLEIGGTIDSDAEIFLSERIPAYLFLSTELSTPVLLVPRNQAVHAVHIMKVAKQDDGTIDLLEDALLSTIGSFELIQQTIVFAVDGQQVVFKEKPPLLGRHDVSGMEQYSAEYVKLQTAYKPSEESLGALRDESRDVRVTVYFGSWCPFCQRYVPRMMKVATELDGSKVKIDFYGFPRQMSTDPVSARAHIDAVPTGVVSVDGKEAGRIEGDQWRAPEAAIQKIIGK